MKIRINLQNGNSVVYDDVREIRALVNTYQTKITYRDTVAFEYEEPKLQTLIWYIENYDIKSIEILEL